MYNNQPIRKSTLFALSAAFLASTIMSTGAHAQDAGKETKADPAAFAMLKEAHDRRENFPAGFAGITAGLTLTDATGEVKGSLSYSSAGDLKVMLTGATKDQEKWVEDELGSAFGHRRGDDFSKGDGSNPLTFVSDDHNPLGRVIALNDKYNSQYRVKDGHITQVTRSMGPTMRFTITVTADRNLTSGKYLPSQFTVTYFDAPTGAIKRIDMFTDTFKKLGDAYIPSSRRVITAENGAFTTKLIKLDDIKSAGVTAAAR